MNGMKAPLKRLYILLNDGPRQISSGRPSLEALLDGIMPWLNYQASVYVISEDPLGQWQSIAEVVEEIREFLGKWGFCQVTLRPVHPLVEPTSSLYDMYRVILEMGRAFHVEGWVHQVTSRWSVHPIVALQDPSEIDPCLELARFMGKRLMIPSFLVPKGADGWEGIGQLMGGRILLEGEGGPIASLFMNDLFDDISHNLPMEALQGQFSWACPSVMIDLQRDRVQRCPWQKEWPMEKWENSLIMAEPGICRQCWLRMPWEMDRTMRINGEDEQADRLHQRIAVWAMGQGDLQGAQGHFHAVADRSGVDELRAEALLYMGILKREEGDVETAYRMLQQAHELDKSSSATCYYLGKCEYEMGDYIAATDLLREALEIGVPHPAEEDLRFMLAISHLKLEEYLEAMEALGGLDGQRPEVAFYKAMALLGLGKTDEALEGFNEALKMGPKDEDLAQVHFYRAYCLKELERYEEALEPLRRSLQLDPDHYDSWNLKGYCLFMLSRHTEAILAFEEALRIKPSSGIDHANIASNLRKLGRLEEAASWYQRALNLDPTLTWAALHLKEIGPKLKG